MAALLVAFAAVVKAVKESEEFTGGLGRLSMANISSSCAARRQPATGSFCGVDGGERRGPALGTPLMWKVGTRDVDGSMEEFLGEVRERLKELNGSEISYWDQNYRTKSSRRSRHGIHGGGAEQGGRKMMSWSELFRLFRSDRKRAPAGAAGRSHPSLVRCMISTPPPPPKVTSRGGRRGRSLQADAASPVAAMDSRRSPMRLHGPGSAVAMLPQVLLRSFSSPATCLASRPTRPELRIRPLKQMWS